MTAIANANQLLLISNSTQHGGGYLDHAENEIRDFAGGRTQVLFIPFALHDRRAYAAKVEARLQKMGLSVSSVHDVSNVPRAVQEAEIVFVGGGNTFRLLQGLYDHDLIDPIRQSIAAGAVYVGSSAGSIVACPTLMTTKDMPIVQPRSFAALDLVPFQISPHYLDPDPTSTHMGETQEERIEQFLEENEAPVIGLREGAMIRVQDGNVYLKGLQGARFFRRNHQPVEVKAGANLRDLLIETYVPAAQVA